MKLDRNINSNGDGKYALLMLRRVRAQPLRVLDAIKLLEVRGLLDYGQMEQEFFVIRIKDKYAPAALAAYAMGAYKDDPEYGLEILNLAKRASESEGCIPD